jgi:hypothetical protein
LQGRRRGYTISVIPILVVAGAILGVALAIGVLATVLRVGPTPEDQQDEQDAREAAEAQFSKPRNEGDLL